MESQVVNEQKLELFYKDKRGSIHCVKVNPKTNKLLAKRLAEDSSSIVDAYVTGSGRIWWVDLFVGRRLVKG